MSLCQNCGSLCECSTECKGRDVDAVLDLTKQLAEARALADTLLSEVRGLRAQVGHLQTPTRCWGCDVRFELTGPQMHSSPMGVLVPCLRDDVRNRNAELESWRIAAEKREQELREANGYTAGLHSQIIELQDLIAKQQWGLDLEGPVGCPWCKAEWGRVDDPPPPHDANCEAAKAMRWPMAT